MTRVVAAFLLLFPSAVFADRITRMNPTEQCVYTAQMKVVAYYYYKQGMPRHEVKVLWHGDETHHEVEFVNGLLNDAYEWLENAGAKEMNLSEQAYGDLVYDACMSGRAL